MTERMTDTHFDIMTTNALRAAAVKIAEAFPKNVSILALRVTPIFIRFTTRFCQAQPKPKPQLGWDSIILNSEGHPAGRQPFT